jgi:DNA-binding GntR family transcriptional regulator
MKCFDRGLKIKEGVDKWAAFSDIIKDIEATAIELRSSAQIQEVINIRNFIHMEDEDIHDSDEDLTDQIVDHYNLKPDEDSQEVPIVVTSPSFQTRARLISNRPCLEQNHRTINIRPVILELCINTKALDLYASQTRNSLVRKNN